MIRNRNSRPNRRSVTFDTSPLKRPDSRASTDSNWLFSTLRRHFKKHWKMFLFLIKIIFYWYHDRNFIKLTLITTAGIIFISIIFVRPFVAGIRVVVRVIVIIVFIRIGLVPGRTAVMLEIVPQFVLIKHEINDKSNIKA